MLISLAAWTLATLAVGWIAGRKWERAARGWTDLRVAKAQVPVLRAAARLLSAKAAAAVLLAAAVAAFSLYTLAIEGGK